MFAQTMYFYLPFGGGWVVGVVLLVVLVLCALAMWFLLPKLIKVPPKTTAPPKQA